MFCPCLQNEEYMAQKRISDSIDKTISRNKRKYFMEEKLLLLGAGASGKSTIIKQMRIIHGVGYKEKDRIGFIPFIHANIYNSIMILIEAMETLRVKYHDEETEGYIEELDEVDDIEALSDDFFEAIQHIWQDLGIQSVYKKRNQFNLLDSAKYYLDSIDRIRKTDFVPTIDDVLRARVPTSGIIEYSFYFDGIDIKLVDVGGQRSERRKWVHCFENITSILFLAAMSEYDEQAIDGIHSNRLNETRSLFRSIISFEILKKASVILFLNKIDIFEDKIYNSNLSTYFPDYDGPIQDPCKAMQFILAMFLSDNPYPQKKTIYSHYTCATNTSNIKVVFNGIKTTVLTRNLKDMIS